MNRNSLYLKVAGAPIARTQDYMERRNALKKLETALASVDLTTKAYFAATVEMGRAMELLCDAFANTAQLFENKQGSHGGTNSGSSTPPPEPALAATPARQNVKFELKQDDIADEVERPKALSDSDMDDDDTPNKAAKATEAPADGNAPADASVASTVAVYGAALASQIAGAVRALPPPAAVAGTAAKAVAAAVAEAHSLYEEGNGVPLHQSIEQARHGVAVALHEFAVSLQQTVSAPTALLLAEFTECETLRHRRNRAQEQYDVDRVHLEKKIEAYEKKGKPLSDSKKYADMFLVKEHSHETLMQSDASFTASYEKLMQSSLPSTRRHITRSFADTTAELCEKLRVAMEALSAAVGKSN